MSNVRCFFLTPTNRYQLSLRRYGRNISTPCPLRHGYHNASVYIEERVRDEQPVHMTQPGKPDAFEGDSRWPTHCGCGYAFEPEDMWQVNWDQLHERSDGGTPCTLAQAPAGAMWDAHWWTDDRKGPDGRMLVVRLPDGCDWMVDGAAYENGKVVADRGWTRTGEVPNVTASPSIKTKRYHGFLKNGELERCGDSLT